VVPATSRTGCHGYDGCVKTLFSVRCELRLEKHFLLEKGGVVGGVWAAPGEGAEFWGTSAVTDGTSAWFAMKIKNRTKRRGVPRENCGSPSHVVSCCIHSRRLRVCACVRACVRAYIASMQESRIICLSRYMQRA
jgi:hypothetical protein